MNGAPPAPAPALLRGWRSLRLLLRLLAGILTVALLFPFYGRGRRWRAVQRWSAGIVRALGIEVVVHGAPPPGAVLGVANHVSWADIQVIHSVWPVRFVAKSEVRGWPAVGWLAARTGTLFIARGRHRQAASTNQAIHRAFADGDAVMVFPEGTTTDGHSLLQFHASLLQPAVDEHVPVVPLALRYLDENGAIDTAPAYVGDDSLLDALRQMRARRCGRAELRFLPAIDGRTQTRRALAEASHAAIARALTLPAAGTGSGTPGGLPAAAPLAAAPKDSRCRAPADSA